MTSVRVFDTPGARAVFVSGDRGLEFRLLTAGPEQCDARFGVAVVLS